MPCSALWSKNMDTIILVGSSLSFGTGLITFFFTGEVENIVSGALILGFSQIGRLMEKKAKLKLRSEFSGKTEITRV